MISITGHTSGIGKFLFETLENTKGFSITNGYDISKEEDRQRIFEESYDSDVLINNAWHVTGQLELLKLFHQKWMYKNKIIINIGSATIYAHHHPDRAVVNTEYHRSKIELHEYVNSFMVVHDKPQIKELILGPVNTPMISNIEVPSYLEVEEILDPIRTLINDRSIRQIFLMKEWMPK